MGIILPVKDKSGDGLPVQLTPFRSAIRHTEPHRHNGYFEMIYLSAGKGIHFIDGRQYTVEPPMLFVIRRDQVHYWDLTIPGEGYVLIIRKEYVDELEDGQLLSLFSAISGYNCLPLKASSSMGRLWEVLLEEAAAAQEHVSEVAASVLKALLQKVMALAGPVVQPINQPGSLYEQFVHALGDGQSVKRTVMHYARLLHTTPQNLNNACRKYAGQSATDVLAGFLINEAKRLLLYTNGSVAEISFTLDFKDPSHFVKYFKRITGQTPQVFRRR